MIEFIFLSQFNLKSWTTYENFINLTPLTVTENNKTSYCL